MCDNVNAMEIKTADFIKGVVVDTDPQLPTEPALVIAVVTAWWVRTVEGVACALGLVERRMRLRVGLSLCPEGSCCVP